MLLPLPLRKSYDSIRTLFVCIVMCSIINSCEEKDEVPTPSITSFSPADGIVGTEVSISGKNFEPAVSANTVNINGTAAKVIDAGRASLRILIPEGATTGRITVTTNGKTGTSSTDFEVHSKLELSGFSPSNGVAGTAITISGNGFSSVPGNNQVTIGGVTAVVTAATSNTLTVTAPALGITGIIEVKANVQAVTSDGTFRYIPKIDNISPAHAALNGPVTLTGSGFSPTPENNTVKVNGVVATIQSATPNQMVILIPAGASTGPITVTVDDQSTTGPTCTIVVEAISAGGTGYETGYGVVSDAAGNAYVVGSFQGTATFGNSNVTADMTDGFVAKYDASAELVWIKTIGGSGNEDVMSVTIDANGNLYIAGGCSADTGFGALTPPGEEGGFVAKMNSNGDFLWVTTFKRTGGHTTSIHKVALDRNGNPVIAGFLGSSLTIGGETMVVTGSQNGFAAKLGKESGTVQWARNFPSTYASYAEAVACDDNGDIFVGGSFFGATTFGANVFTTSDTDLDAFFVKMSDNGNVISATHLSGTGWSNLLDMKVDHAGDVVITGYYGSALTGGGLSLTGAGYENPFVAKFSAAGNHKWSLRPSSFSSYANGRALAIGGDNNVYVTGFFYRELGLDNVKLTAGLGANDYDAFVVKIDPGGNALWGKRAGGEEIDHGYGIHVDSNDVIYTTGFFRDGDGSFGSTILSNAGTNDAFLWKIWQD